MAWRSPSRAWYALILAGAAASVLLGIPVEERMAVLPVAGQRLAGQRTIHGIQGGGDGPRTTQKIGSAKGARTAQYGFQNFGGDKLEVDFSIPEKDFADYNDAWGYTEGGLDAVKAWRNRARQDALKAAVAKHQSQSQLDAAIADVEKQYKAKQKEYLSGRGFALEPGGVVEVDMPALVRKNGPLIKPLAQEFGAIAEKRKYAALDVVGAVLSFVQTAMFYKEPDAVDPSGKHTGGLLPPLTSVALGWGDCDTKTGVLASILSNWPQMKTVGVSVPGHYLMGVVQVPDKGDAFIEYRGLQYTLLEPAGPAWLPPGRVGEETSALLGGRDGYKIDPFF
ncbi:MAG TPA: hypothetical protein VN915_07130 [Elusimicrobiota bacterium]|nr:hypothetical protein [Elusimicrobiota bacterium]